METLFLVLIFWFLLLLMLQYALPEIDDIITRCMALLIVTTPVVFLVMFLENLLS